MHSSLTLEAKTHPPLTTFHPLLFAIESKIFLKPDVPNVFS